MSGGVFISYRREEAGFAGRIYDRLAKALGRESVFIDVDNIPAGLDFIDVLSERVGRCDALIAIIGRNWLASADKNNRRRLDDPSDFVRIEIEAALKRNVPVIPVLIDGAVMPQADDLPDGLKNLARRQGIEISHNRFDSDAEQLTDALSRIEGKKLSPAGARPPAPVPKPLGGPARWLLAAAGVAAIAGGAVFFYTPRGAHEEQSRREEKAKPTSDVLKTLPLPQTTSTFKAPAPNTAADETPTGNIAASPAANPTDTVAPDPPTASQQWLYREDFVREYNTRIAESYPDDIEARCDNGVPQRRAHWSPRPAGQHFQLNRSVEGYSGLDPNEKDFDSDRADMIARGFTMKKDYRFPGCDGSKQHLTLWMKG